MDKVFIKDLLVRGIIRVYDWERQQTQDILISIAIDVDLRQACATDNIQNCIDYDALAQKVVAHTESVQRLTVEPLANDMAQIGLAEPLAESARIRVE